MAGENIDLSSDHAVGKRRDSSRSSTNAGRRFLGIQFDCCGVYTRVYVNQDETAYEGNCPKCAKAVRLEIGPGGTSSRFFTVSWAPRAIKNGRVRLELSPDFSYDLADFHAIFSSQDDWTTEDTEEHREKTEDISAEDTEAQRNRREDNIEPRRWYR